MNVGSDPRHGRRLAFALLGCYAAVAGCLPEHFRSYAYRSVTLDLEGLTIRPQEPVGLECPRELRECYLRRTDVRGRPHVDHLGPFVEDSRYERRRVYFNMFFVAPDQSLIYRSKSQVVLSGQYGTVYARSVYYYAPAYGKQPNTFEVAAYLLDAPFEPSEAAASLPAGSRLSAVSLVRVFRHAPEFLVISADYGPEGALRAFHVNGTIGGRWTNLPEASREAQIDLGVTSYGDRSPHRTTFGFPGRFPVDEYLAAPQRVWQITRHQEHLTAVTFHYDRNRYGVQDVFVADAIVESKKMQYAVTKEDSLLSAIDERRAFGGSPAPVH